MDKISKLINEAHTVNISLEVSYYNELIGYFKEAEVSNNENKLFRKRKTYHIETSSESIIRTLYNDARFSLALLSHEQLANALQVLQSYSYKKFYQEIKAFTSKFNRDETNEIHEISFIYSMRRHLICDIPNKGRITHPFLCGLSSELLMKNRYMDALADDIKKLLGEETENNEMNTKGKSNNKTLFSIPQWASIFYYADESKLLPNTKFKKEKREAFMTLHKIDTTLDYFNKCYLEVKVLINKKNNYPIDKLEDIIPFMKEHYKEAESRIKSDIIILKEEKNQRNKFD